LATKKKKKKKNIGIANGILNHYKQRFKRNYLIKNKKLYHEATEWLAAVDFLLFMESIHRTHNQSGFWYAKSNSLIKKDVYTQVDYQLRL